MRIGLDPRLPDLVLPSILEVPFARLAERGIVNYIFDVDNTLLPQFSQKVEEKVVRHLQKAQREGWIQSACLLSNAMFGSERQLRMERIGKQLGIPDLFAADFWSRKPHPVGFFWALERMQCTAASTAIVGDQIYSDIVGGNRMGLYTILVSPPGPDHWSTGLVMRRLREWLLLRHYGISRPLWREAPEEE
ncbi:HAD hydrolase-like protein [bacterium]|nr:HAD hydrolase-like protein [bacterium]